MERRVERILTGRGMCQGLASIGWSGTFHAIGARLLRDFAHSIGLNSAFTIHDREDSADLLNLVRHHLGFSGREQRFPLKAPCLAIYSRAVNSGDALDRVLTKHFPWCAGFEDDLRRLFDGYVEAKQNQHRRRKRRTHERTRRKASRQKTLATGEPSTHEVFSS
jgi:ATP-dependent DNA helicase UvrD/PcrA